VRREVTAYDLRFPVSEATEAVVFNAVPLLMLAGAYAAVAGALLPAAWRGRRQAHPLDRAVVLVFPGIATASVIFAVLVIRTREPFGGHTWVSLAAILAALAPSFLLLARWGDRAFLVGGVGRTSEAEDRLSKRDRELSAVAEISHALVRAASPAAVAKPLVRHVSELLGVGFAGAVLVSADGRLGEGLYAELEGNEAPWWQDVRVDLRDEPSGIASAFFDAAPVTVYDVSSSTLVSPRLVELVGAESGAWIPMIAGERVIGVLAVASTEAKRAFSTDELALLQAVAAEAALALERLRSSAELSHALGREQTVSKITRRIREELEPDGVMAVAQAELTRALQIDRVEIVLGSTLGEGVPILAHGERIGMLVALRARPFDDGEAFLVSTVAAEIGASLQTAWLLAENQRRLEQQAALLHAAQVVTSELDLDSVLQLLVEEVTKLLGADAADCYLLDRERGVLRCAAVNGFTQDLVGFEFIPAQGVAGAALREARPVSSEDSTVTEPVPHAAYAEYSRSLVAPMVWAGETHGVLGVGVRDETRSFSAADIEMLEAFASLASLALRNAESFADSSRQARIQRGFYRIATLLGEPLSLDETYDAAAQAAGEALGGDYAAVLVKGGADLMLVGGHALPDSVRALAMPRALVEAAQDGQMIAATSVADDDRFDEAWRAAPFTSLLAIPVPGDGSGIVLVLFRDPHEFTRDDLELAQQVAGAARGALDRSRLFEAERAARSLSQQLARTGSLLATELDPVAVLESVVEEAIVLLAADAAALAALEDDELVVTAAVGEGAEQALGARSPSTGWVAGDVVQSRLPVAYDDTSADQALAESDALLASGHRAYLGVPLTLRDGALHGVLSVYSSVVRVWREEEVQALGALAASASVALSNAELYQRVAVEREQSVAILANVADGIVAVDRDGHVVLWNRAAEEITGVPAAEAIGRTTAQVLQRDLESEGGGTNRSISIPRAGVEVWLSLSEAVMRDPTSAIAGRIFAFRDISSEHVVEQMKSDFVSTVSVELRTPLTSIYGFAQTLLREDVAFGEAERRTFLEFIARESERLTAIVDALLNVARLDTGDLDVALETTDVGRVVERVLAAAEDGSLHRLVADVNGGLAAHADPDKLRQVLDQLVSNAVKYSPAGGTVVVTARRLDDAVEVAVVDEGPGVPAAERERIFSKFYKAGEAQGRGTGLGLFIAQGLVQEMGGRIWVDSEEGKGARFAFVLPLAEDVTFPTVEA
jgi:PAS domain S-box-containing protein